MIPGGQPCVLPFPPRSIPTHQQPIAPATAVSSLHCRVVSGDGRQTAGGQPCLGTAPRAVLGDNGHMVGCRDEAAPRLQPLRPTGVPPVHGAGSGYLQMRYDDDMMYR